MLVREVMTLTVGVVHPDDRLRDAAEKMKSAGVEPLPVCDGDRVVGMLTEKDIEAEAQRAGLMAGMTAVREAMNPEVVYCFDDQDVAEAAHILDAHRDHGHSGILVLNRAKRLVGIVPVGALARHRDDIGDNERSEGDLPFEAMDRDPVDHMSEESFPASDPPAPPGGLDDSGPDTAGGGF